jgi:N utilization substance protein B
VAASSGSAGRRQAVELVFEAFSRDQGLLDLVEQRAALVASNQVDDAVPLLPEAVGLVRGVAEHQVVISEWLDTYSHGWTQRRMAAVDRAILYVGAYEVVFADDVPDTAAINGAADLAGKLSTGRSAGFVSGVLGRLSKIKPTLL